MKPQMNTIVSLWVASRPRRLDVARHQVAQDVLRMRATDAWAVVMRGSVWTRDLQLASGF